MDIQAEKLSLIQWLVQLTDKGMIAKIQALRNENADWWDSIPAEEKEEIEKGLLQADQGVVKPQNLGVSTINGFRNCIDTPGRKRL